MRVASPAERVGTHKVFRGGLRVSFLIASSRVRTATHRRESDRSPDSRTKHSGDASRLQNVRGQRPRSRSRGRSNGRLGLADTGVELCIDTPPEGSRDDEVDVSRGCPSARVFEAGGRSIRAVPCPASRRSLLSRSLPRIIGCRRPHDRGIAAFLSVSHTTLAPPTLRARRPHEVRGCSRAVARRNRERTDLPIAMVATCR